MVSDKRFFGPLLSSAQHRSIFAGDDETKRLSLVRNQIVVVRKAWTTTASFHHLLDVVRKFVKPEIQPKSIRVPIQRLLQGYHDYADMDVTRPSHISSPEQYDALELYCSKAGYDYLYRLISETLRLEVLPDDLLLTAVTLVEFLTIDLYNLRLSHLGDDRYANFQGITYRGMRVDQRTINEYREVANRPDVRKRSFAIPLAPISTSTDEIVMSSFADGNPTTAAHMQMHWKIHIHGIDPPLLSVYAAKYPESIVTSICSMPVGSISPFGEKEILLRGVSFQLLRMTTSDDEQVHKLELVMINANRDHTTELGSNEAEKKMQRDAFRRMAMVSKYEVCASLASSYSAVEAEQYRELQQGMLDELQDIDEISVERNTDLANACSGEVAVWHGAIRSSSFPRHYAALRRDFQFAVSNSQWPEVGKILNREYDWHRGTWYTVPKIDSADKSGWTLLHELAVQGPPAKYDDDEGRNHAAWQRIMHGIAEDDVWKSVKTFDEQQKTAYDLAVEHGRDELVPLLRPVIRTALTKIVLEALEEQLHELIREKAGRFIQESNFNMPQLSILTEMRLKKAEVWIPIPGMYGGFSIKLVGHDLHVTTFETVVGKLQPKKTLVILRHDDALVDAMPLE